MKKIIVILVCLFSLVACSSSHDAKISKNDVLWTYENETFTSNDLYELAKSQDYSGLVISKIISVIGDNEDIDVDALKEEIGELYDQYVAAGYSYYLSYYYADRDSYIEDQVVNSVVSKLMEKVAEENFDKYVEEYTPYKAEVAYFDTTEQAQAVIDAVNAETNTFAFAASENGYANSIEETVYTDDADLPLEVKEVVKNSESGLSGIITTSITAKDNDGNEVITPRYYLINIVEKDVNNFKDDFISYIINNVLDSAETLNDYMKKYDVEIHDQYIYEKLVDTYSAISVK